MTKRGFTSLYIVIVLTSLIFLVLVIIEAAAGYALRSVGENLCMITGESLLSEYQKDLWKRYGIFALRSSDERLTDLAEFYIEESLDSGGNNLLTAELFSCGVSAEEYPALNAGQFSRQVREMALLMLAENLLDGAKLSGVYHESSDSWVSYDSMKDTTVSSLKQLASGSASDESGEDGEEDQEDQTKSQAESLLERYQEASKEPDADLSLNKEITDAAVKAGLPSGLMGVRQRNSLLFSKISLDLTCLPENEYIIDRCSFALNKHEDTVLELEIEYILYGKFSDSENQKKIKGSLFWLRSALNLSHIYSDSRKLSEVSSMAACVFPMIPTPLAIFILSSAWAGVEAQYDVRLLWGGGTVPFIKAACDWHYGLDGLSDAPAAAPADSSSEFGDYEDYLRLFLLVLPSQEKLIRLMDVMQLNIASDGKTDFNFRDYAFGFTLSAIFKKKVHLFGGGFGAYRSGTVTQHHVY
jgi:hypothetical protein